MIGKEPEVKPRIIFFTLMGNSSIMFSEVPYDAELQGVAKHAGNFVFVWTTREGLGPMTPTKNVEFYATFCGGELPEDAGEMVATVPTMVTVQDEEQEVELLIFIRSPRVH